MADVNLISCIVPVYNGAAFLAEAIDSILGQTHRPLEIIIVDDGSTDGTAGVIAGYGDRVIVLRQDNAGPGAARNRGLEAARGDYLAFLDADDLWAPQKLALQLEQFDRSPELDYCLTHVEHFLAAELTAMPGYALGPRLERPMPGYLLQTLMARRSLFERIGRFDTSRTTGEDTDWFMRAADSGAATKVLPDVLVRRRIHKANMTRLLDQEIGANLLDAVKDSLDRRRRTGRTRGD